MNPVRKFFSYIYNHPYALFIVLVALELITITFDSTATLHGTVHWVFLGFRIVIGIYFFFSLVHMIRMSLKRMLEPKNFRSLLEAYTLFIIGIIIAFSISFNLIDDFGVGHLTYGVCDGSVDLGAQPDYISHDYLYFSAITFFTVGYGDICPIGLSKLFAVLAAFVGNVISLFLVAIIINNYMQKRNPKKLD